MNQPAVLLLTSPICPHCDALKNTLLKLEAEGLLKDLQIVDISTEPELARKFNVRTVPWMQIDRFQFQGVISEMELRQWLTEAGTRNGEVLYFEYLLANGQLDQAIRIIRQYPDMMTGLIMLTVKPELDMRTRLGISAVIEEFEGDASLQAHVRQLGELAEFQEANIRADIAHFLSLTHSDAAVPFLQALANDPDHQVKEIASDALQDFVQH